jgi:hypothetical protein
VVAIPKPSKDPKIPQSYVRLASCSRRTNFLSKFSTNCPKAHWRKEPANANQFGLRAHHSTTLQCMRLADHVTLNFNNKIYTGAVFLDIGKAFDTTWLAL